MRSCVTKRPGHSAQWAGLEPQPDGALTLACVPGTVDGKPIVVTGAWAVASSGIAVGDCQDLYLADAAQHRIVRRDLLCDARFVVPGASGGSTPGPFQNPCG